MKHGNMNRATIALVAVFAVVLGSAPFGRQALGAADDGFSDEQVAKAIQKGADYLWSLQLPNGSWAAFGGYPVGPTAAITYALMESGVKPTDPRMEKALTWMSQQKCTKTYSLGLRCQAWLAAIKQGSSAYKEFLRQDVEVLIKSTKDGSYGYDATGKPASGDNSCSQYGLLGVWAGALGNLEIPRTYWQLVFAHWVNTQNPDGGWAYGHSGGTTATMATAGVASLFVCFDSLFTEAFIKCDLGDKGRLAQAPMTRGLDWFDKNFRGTINSVNGYYLYGVERIGLASGYKYFGKVDWYKEGAKLLLKSQAANGAWNGGHGGPPVVTAQCMLFLIRGRKPVLFNKLEFEGDWNNRPRDMAGLSAWVSTAYEDYYYWQIITLEVPAREWHDAPIVYISGAKKPEFSDEDLNRLREYVYQGGAIFSVTECSGQAFDDGIREVYKKLFPDYELTKLGLNHDIYSWNDLSARAGSVTFYEISNGIRPLVIHVPQDLSRSWQLQRTSTDRWAFQAAANVYKYVTGWAFRARGSMTWPLEPATAPDRTVKIARVKWGDGNWDPEPLAYERFGRLMLKDYKIKVETEVIDVAGLAKTDAKLATLTGTGDLTLTDDQKETIREFIEDGGTLLIDAAGGDQTFASSAEGILKTLFPAGMLKRIAATDPLLTLEGNKIEGVQYRWRTKLRIDNEDPNLKVFSGLGRLIFSTEDITGGLVGYPSYTCDGYDPKSAFQIMRNIVMLAAPTEAPKTPPADEKPQ